MLSPAVAHQLNPVAFHFYVLFRKPEASARDGVGDEFTPVLTVHKQQVQN